MAPNDKSTSIKITSLVIITPNLRQSFILILYLLSDPWAFLKNRNLLPSFYQIEKEIAARYYFGNQTFSVENIREIEEEPGHRYAITYPYFACDPPYPLYCSKYFFPSRFLGFWHLVFASNDSFWSWDELVASGNDLYTFASTETFKTIVQSLNTLALKGHSYRQGYSYRMF